MEEGADQRGRDRILVNKRNFIGKRKYRNVNYKKNCLSSSQINAQIFQSSFVFTN